MVKSMNNADLRSLLHEIRNPINAISMNAELGKMLLENGADHKQIKQLFDKIIVQCQHCSDTLSQHD